MMRVLLKSIWHGLAVVGLGAIALAGTLWWSGVSTRTPPTSTETVVSRWARGTMIPASSRNRTNPEPLSQENLRAGLEHWADHCASCHANDGSGDTEMGRGLYPPAPDMRLTDTQRLTDGELFYLIEHGVKLTGMPAWGTGTPEGEQSTWHLVQFIRHLPRLTDEERMQMEELNPRGAADWQALEEERRFLAGDGDAPTSAPSTHVHKGGSQ